MTGQLGTVYLLHFERKLKHAGHYLGFTPGVLTDRIAKHRLGNGARLTQVIREKGIGFVVARVWNNVTRTDERRLHNRKENPRLCPICMGNHHMRKEEN